MRNITPKLCLNPLFRLRTQMMLAFGSTAVIALGSFILIGLYTVSNSGNSVQNQARSVVSLLIKHTLSRTAEYLAETMTKKFNNVGGAASILSEITRDRFVGYPNLIGYEDDAYVPFRDSVSGLNIYPIDAPYLELEWQIQANVNQDNYQEHIIDRPYEWYAGQNVDTSNAVFFMQGVCDPQAINSSDPTYHPQCNDQSNNVRRGGLKPTPTNWGIYEKAKDIAWALKPIYESHSDVKTVGIFFANSGAGANIQYPATVVLGGDSYESIGCDWMFTTHPRTGNVVAQQWEIENCHPYLQNVSMREYNALERGWCRDQVERDMDVANGKLPPAFLNVIATGPYLDALSAVPLWVMTFGQAVFDRATGQFIACTLLDMSVTELHTILLESSQVGNTSEVAMARWDEFGTVMVASQWDPKTQNASATLTHHDLGLGVTRSIYQQMINLVDYSQPWDPQEVIMKYHDTFFHNDGMVIMMYPVPFVPREYDPFYKPLYMIVISISDDEAYRALEDMEVLIDQDVQETWEEIAYVGGIGFGVVVLMIAYISSTLTKPLRWMQKVAGIIVDNAGGADLKKGLTEVMHSKDARPFCAPRTEVTKLLQEFEQMIQEFSTEGTTEVAGMAMNEVKNNFQWRRMFEDIYPWETEEPTMEKVPGTTIPRQLSISNAKVEELEVFDDELTTESTTFTGSSILSAISASIQSSLVQASYYPVVQKVLGRTNSIVDSVKKTVVASAVKAGLLKASEERIQGPPLVHRGENIDRSADASVELFEVSAGDNSFLFWWTTLLVGIPILVTAIMIFLTVASNTTNLIPLWLDQVKQRSFIMERNSIITSNIARASFGEAVMMRFIRDLHLYSRLAGWLLFGAINRANSFTELMNRANECKYYAKDLGYDNGTLRCPFYMDPDNAPCDCSWDDAEAHIPAPWNVSAGMNYKECQINDDNTSAPEEYNMTDSRYLQRRYFEGQSDDVDEFGTRMTTSYPMVANTSEEGNWWDNITLLPGYYKGQTASGYNTTYDRIRVMSAMATVDIPLYNYHPGIEEEKNLGTFVGFEFDGMMIGYTGCAPSHPNYAHWRQSSKSGGVVPDLCPFEKYGYDARCRGWYSGGKTRRGVYITPPYEFASEGMYAGSATFSLEDPITKALVGQALMDFLPDGFMRALDAKHTLIGHGTTGFPVVITPEADADGNEVLVGPGYEIGNASRIGRLVLPHDEDGSQNQVFFEEEVAKRMRKGESGHKVFRRTTKDGTEEEVMMSYAPLEQRTLSPVNSSQFSAGCTSSSTLVYSLGFGITMKDLVLPFTVVENEVTTDIREVQYISLALIVAAVLSVLYMTYSMCHYLSQPIMVLIAIVKSIRNKNMPDELPRLGGGSCEIYDVYESLEQLCKIVRFSNTAIVKGDRNKSYRIMEDALDLFLRMGNQKALGVANNNLGTMVLQEQMERSSVTAQSNEVYFNGVKYFEEAIRIGTHEYQNADFDDERGDFVKQLANRYFNRGMFYIVNRNHPMATPELEATGVNDLVRAKQLDQEAYLIWRERGQLVDQASNEFGSILRRARGILTLMQDADFQDVWGVEGLIEKASDMIHNPAFEDSNLFKGVNIVTRKQQVNDLKMQYAMAKGETFEAAQIAIRMLVEDEYIIDTVIMNCVTTLNKHYHLEGSPMAVPNLAKGVKRETRRVAVDSLRQAKNVIFCLDYSGSMNGARMKRANDNLLWVYEDHCLDKDHIGFLRFNHSVDTKLFFDLGRKGDNQQLQLDVLRQATDAEGGTRLYAALNKSVTMAIDSGNDFDTWIIALTDGESAWDFPAKEVIRRIEKNNKKGGPQIHVIIIGFEVPSEVADSVSIITRITDKSMYIDAKGGLDEMDSAFETVASVITGTAITMETF